MFRGFFTLLLLMTLQLPFGTLQAQVSLSGQPIEVSVDSSGSSSQLHRLIQLVGQSMSSATPCSEVAEVPGTLLCISSTGWTMNSMLARASSYVEGIGNFRRGEVITQDKLSSLEIRSIGGHDLQASDLLAFFADATDLCERALEAEKANSCFNRMEESFYS